LKQSLLERDIEKDTCDYARRKGALALKFVSPGYRGVCDRLLILKTGRMFFIEFKQRGIKPGEDQLRHHNKLSKMNVTVYIVDDVSVGRLIIDLETGGI
jgi:hypothetical protein